MKISNSLLYCSLVFGVGCAQLHHVQLGDIVSDEQFVAKPFEVMVSETGVSAEEIGAIAHNASHSNFAQDVKFISDIISLFQMGPRTGKPVYNASYARNVLELVYEKCPSGKITGLMSIRETRSYPVISGEIVKITGYCMLKKGRKNV